MALFFGAGAAAAQDTVRDDFNTTAWSESSGIRPWSGDWSGSLGPDAVRQQPEGELRIRQNGTSIQRSLNLSGYDVATLNLSIRAEGALSNGDRFAVDVFNGSTWRTLEIIQGSSLGASFAARSYVVTQDISSNMAVRLRIDTGTGNPGRAFAIDFVEVRTLAPTCFIDSFDATTLNTADWATSSVSGGFGQPRIVGNRLRLTDASGNVSTASSLLRLFPGADNRVVLEFDFLAYGGSGADGVAFTLSDANITPVAGGFGGSLGYAQRSGVNGFAGGWLGVGIDEFGNFSNASEARVGGPGFRVDSVALRGSGSGTTGYPYLAGTATLTPGIDISGATPGPNHRYRITVDNRQGVVAGAQVSVERNTGAGFATLVAPFNIFTANASQAAVPANFRLSLTGSTGGSTNIHELDNLRVCATRVNQIIEVDHYRFFHDGQGLTCGPESIRVVACRDSNCTQEVAGPIQVTLSPSGWVGGNSQTINSGQTLQLRRVTPGNVTLTVTASNPPRRPFTPDRCFVGGVQQANCTLNFADSGFLFDVQNHDADAVQTVSISAVRKDITTQACVPGFDNVTRSLSFWSTYQNPTTGTQRVAIDGTNIATASPGTARSLAFNAAGVATMTVRYPDAGSMRLNASYTGSAANGDAGLTMTGQDDFVARPILHLVVPGNPSAADSNGAVFRRAGEAFATTVTARNVNNAVTPNFGREVAPETVNLRSTLVAPIGGNNPPPVADVGFGAVVSGVLSGNWRWDEVGIVSMAAHLVDNDYLGAGDLSRPTASTVPLLGRFIPARLDVTPNAPSFANACVAGSFGYLGQEFGFSVAPEFTVSGRNVQGAVTGNYVNVAGGGAPLSQFWKLSTALANRTYSNTAATTAVLSRTTVGDAYAAQGNTAVPFALPSEFDGTGLLRVPGAAPNRDRLTYAKPVAPAAPFNAEVSMTIAASDLTDSDGACYDVAPLGSCDAFSITGIAGTIQRWGRIVTTNAFGPELIDLQIPMRAEFFNGSAFVPNTDDACSIVSSASLVDANPSDALLPSETCVQDVGSPGASGLGCSVTGPVARRYSATPTAGVFNLWLRASGAGNAGVLDLTPNVPVWLRFNWTGSGPIAPTARVGFGVYQGDRRAIFEREVY
jgi:MSHA biogenesis protein MshQ